MNTVADTIATTATNATGTQPAAAQHASIAVEPSSLLPEPSAQTLAATDPLSLIYLFESKDQQLGINAATTRIRALQADRHQALQQEQDAIQKAQEAAKHKSFWDSLGDVLGEVAKVAGVVASVAAAIATLGAATPVAAIAIGGAVLSSAAFVDSEVHVLPAWADTALSLGGAACSVGAGFFATGVKASSVLSTIRAAGGVASGAATAGSAFASIEAGQAQSRSDQAAADEVAAQARSDHALRLIRIAIDDAQSSDRDAQQRMQAIASTKAIQNETSFYAATAVRG